MRRHLLWCLTGIAACVSCTTHVRAPEARRRAVLALPDDTRGALTAMLQSLIVSLPSDTAAACIVIRGPAPAYFYSPDSLLLEALRTPVRRVVSHGCPPTYDLMAVHVDSNGRSLDPARPPGYIDPYWIVVDRYDVFRADSASMSAVATQGTRKHHFACTARRETQRAWRARCVHQGMSMSAVPRDESQQPRSARSWDGPRWVRGPWSYAVVQR